jgi:hypothetical protein
MPDLMYGIPKIFYGFILSVVIKVLCGLYIAQIIN